MRPEYHEAIRYRRWAELEHYAKKRPEQILADTVYQLAESIGEKPDRKALKRILWILSQAGFEGRDYQADPPEPKAKTIPSKLLTAAMSLSDTHGYVGLLACANRAPEVDSIMALINDRWGFCDARVLMRTRIGNVFAAQKAWMEGAPRLCATIPTAYALYRLARGWKLRKHPLDLEDPPTAFWKKLFDHAEEIPHPALELQAIRMEPDARRAFLSGLDVLDHWRLTLTPQDEAWSDIHPIRWDTELTEREKEEAIGEALCEHGVRIFDEAFDHLLERLRDAAWVLHSTANEVGLQLLDAAQDFERRRSESTFAYWLVAHTALDLSKNLEEDDFDPASAGEWP